MRRSVRARCVRSVQKFKKCHASKHTCERHVDVCIHPYVVDLMFEEALGNDHDCFSHQKKI